MESYRIGKEDLIPAVIWMILGVCVSITSYGLDIGQFNDPGPGMMPFLLGIILTCVSIPMIALGLMDFHKERKRDDSLWSGLHFWRVGSVVITLVIYGFMFERAGFSVTTSFCLFFLFKVVSSEKTGKALVFTIMTVVSLYALFIILLNTQMPSFPWGMFR